MLEAMIFARDLMERITEHNDCDWESPTLIGASCFIMDNEPFEQTKDNIIDVVVSFTDEKDDLIQECLNDLTITGVRNFGQCILEATPEYFPLGFTPTHFLAFCTMVCGVAAKCYLMNKERYNYFPEMAAGIIGLVLTGHMATGEFARRGGWIQLGVACTKIESVQVRDEFERKFARYAN